MINIRKNSIFLLVGILVFYISYSLVKGTYSTDVYSLEFDTSVNVDKENNFIKYLSVGTTVSDFLEKVNVIGDDVSVSIYDSFGIIKNENDLLASGDVIRTFTENIKNEEYILSVMGDASGDGIVDLIDLVQIRKHIVGWFDPDTNETYAKSGIYYDAIDMNKDGVIDLIDLVRMRKMIVGIELEDDNETVVSYTATFDKNGVTDIGDSSLTCTSTDTDKCEITTPLITTDNIVVGWSTNKDSKTADVLVDTKIELTRDVTYYAITKKTYTAIFDSTDLDYLEFSSLSCDVYNGDSSCNIVLPVYNKLGHFNSFWSPYKEASSELGSTKWSWKYFNQVGHSYELTNDVTLYPNFNHFHYDLSSNTYKYRAINMSVSRNVGKTVFEFEEGIPQGVVDNFIGEMEVAYDLFPWLFFSGKAFVMTEETYSSHSTAYGLTHQMYVSYGGDSHFTIDLKYDTSGAVVKNAIDINAALHELAHAWDSYYYFKTGDKRISSLSDFDNFYNSINSKLYINSNGNTISKVETFAGMFTNYYWHVLEMDDSKSYYALKSGNSLNVDELNNLKILMEKYINISKNGYKENDSD